MSDHYHDPADLRLIKEMGSLAPAEFKAWLNLDQIVDRITDGKEEYNLKPFFFTPQHSIEVIAYRHEVFRDFENESLFEIVQSFAKKMHVSANF